MLRQLRALDRARCALLHTGQQPQLLRCFAADAAAEKPFYSVPAGHINSDLSDTACNIGLNRLRDLTMRRDIRVQTDAGPATLIDIFKGKRVVVFGVPDMGKVCSEQQVPSYLRQVDALKELGVQQMYCFAVADLPEVQKWAASVGLTGPEVQAVADDTGAFTRALGVEMGQPGTAGPKSQRYAALVDNGLLLRLKVESSVADVSVSSAEHMVQVVKDYYAR